MSIPLNVLREFAVPGDPGQKGAAIWLSNPMASQKAVAFASLVDLARIQFGASSIEICDACSTVNLGAAHHCKGCSHKLPAYYAACEGGSELAGQQEPARPAGHETSFSGRGVFRDFAAFALVVNLLVMVAEFMPFR